MRRQRRGRKIGLKRQLLQPQEVQCRWRQQQRERQHRHHHRRPGHGGGQRQRRCRDHGERGVAGRTGRGGEGRARSRDEKFISALRLLGELDVRDEGEIGCAEYSTEGGEEEWKSYATVLCAGTKRAFRFGSEWCCRSVVR